MLQSKLKVDSVLFNYETTYRTDYRHGEILEYPKTVFKPVQGRRTAAYRNVGVHTMTEWKEVPPFSVTHAPKDIVRTNPHVAPKCFEKHEDPDWDMARKTRPRVVMTPAVSLDDVTVPSTRAIICADAYTSETTRAMREAIAARPPHKHVKTPLPVQPASANPVSIVEEPMKIVLPKLKPPCVSPEWRVETASWDDKQLRGHCGQTAEYWLGRDQTKCRACDETAVVKAHRKMLCELTPPVIEPNA